MSLRVSTRETRKAYVRRLPYADHWVANITPSDIFKGYTKSKGDYLFIWINKTAGASIAKTLGINKDAYNHYTATELREILGAKTFDNVFTFCFIRNPWDKVVSEFRFRIWTCQNGLTLDSTFSEWVRSTYIERDPKYYDWPKMFLPQLEWITDQEGDIIVDFVGRFENLQADFDVIANRLNLQCRLLCHENRSRNSTSYRSYYNEETRSIVGDWFRADIEFFGYKF
jgi:chondroitin 4-sulfotransferase 11